MSTEPSPHALRVQFINRDVDYEEDEVVVYADGYGLTADAGNNIKEATRFELRIFQVSRSRLTHKYSACVTCERSGKDRRLILSLWTLKTL